MIVANGSIELRIGDIALQETDVIVISTTFNGLKEGVIERLGEIQNEVTYIDVDGTMYTETNGGKLNCKRILFSNWLPISLINNDQILRSSIRKFVTKSMEYITKEKATKSIAFAIPDTSTDETILAEIMVAEIKRHLETNKLPLKIVFVCLPEQENLYQQFSNLIPTMKDNFMYLDYPTTDNYFELEYERLLLELLRYTKPGFTTILQHRSSRTQNGIDDSPKKSSVEQRSLIKNITGRKSSKAKHQTMTNIISDIHKEERKPNNQVITSCSKRKFLNRIRTDHNN
ncbi:unnamed protein product [Rotaria sordida]|uniref:Macro domain-containing protein n=1 Tax=Rotaria sordida TaxID=392033 RepID=A0A815CNQ3_9BILA|nr:unnamed protein product [Rotaria sordida]